LLSATRFLNPIGWLHGVDSTPQPPEFKFGWDFSPLQLPRAPRGSLSLKDWDSSETFRETLALGLQIAP